MSKLPPFLIFYSHQCYCPLHSFSHKSLYSIQNTGTTSWPKIVLYKHIVNFGQIYEEGKKKEFYPLKQSVFFHLFSHMNNIKYRIFFFSLSCLFLSHKSIHSHSQVTDKAFMWDTASAAEIPWSVLLASVPWCTGWGNIRCWDIMGPLLKADKIRFRRLEEMWKKSWVCHQETAVRATFQSLVASTSFITFQKKIHF